MTMAYPGEVRFGPDAESTVLFFICSLIALINQPLGLIGGRHHGCHERRTGAHSLSYFFPRK